jgi:hypothetical protein
MTGTGTEDSDAKREVEEEEGNKTRLVTEELPETQSPSQDLHVRIMKVSRGT